MVANLNNAARASVNKPKLEHIYVGLNGSVKAVYADNTVLLLSAEGQSFTHVSCSGVKTVQLCEYCLSRFAPLLTELLDFRNQHVDVPVSCSPLRQQLAKHGQLFQLGYPITDLCWPATPEEAFQQQLVELPDRQRVVVRSRCCSARIMLEYTGLRFAICYPLLLDHDAASNEYTYTWQTQVFSRNQYPARWQPALAVACAVADNAAQGLKISHQPQPHLQLPHQDQSQTGIDRRPSSCRSLTSPTACQSRSSSPIQRCSSPLQRQHRAWQPQRQLSESPGPRGTCSITSTRYCRTAHSPPGSPVRLEQQYCQAVSEHQPAGTNIPGSSISCVTQLPISDKLMHILPPCQQALRQRQQQQQQAQHYYNSSCSSSSGSKLAAALAQALGQRQGSCSTYSSSTTREVAAASLGRSWWLEPCLLLPTDEPLQMMWTREATFVFVQDVEEVEVWLHADDSCLYSFQSGAFVTHLLPKAAAASWDSAAAGNVQHGLAVATSDAAAATPAILAAASATSAASWGKATAGDMQHSLAADSAPATTAAVTSPTWSAAAAVAWDNAAAGNLQHSLAVIGSSTAASAAAAAALQHDLAYAGSDKLDTTGLLEGVVDPSDMSRVYAASSLPEMPITTTVTDNDGRTEVVRVPLGQIAAAALKFRNAMARVKHSSLKSTAATIATAAATAHSTSHQQQCFPREHQQQQQQLELSTDILEQQDVPGLGSFTAYADDRIRVLFADRTILSLAAGHSVADLVMPDGSLRTVPTAKPLGAEEYVQAALEFSAWSSITPEHRAAALRLQALVAAELRSSARMAAICEWGSTDKLPLPAAAAAQVAAEHSSTETQHASAAAAEEWRAGTETDDAADLAGYAEISQSSGTAAGALVIAPQDSWVSDTFERGGSGRMNFAVGACVQRAALSQRQMAEEQMLQENVRLLDRLRV